MTADITERELGERITRFILTRDLDPEDNTELLCIVADAMRFGQASAAEAREEVRGERRGER